MNNKFSDFDKYSNRIGFFFNDKEKIGTFLGFFLTLLYILFSLIIFIIFIIITIRRKNVRVYDSTIYSKDIPSFDINNTVMNFAFGLENPETNNRFIDETIYIPKIMFYDKTTIDGEFQKTEMEYEECNLNSFGDNYKNIFTNNALNNSYCLKNYNISLKGGYNYKSMSFIRIRLYPCINNTENNNFCKSQEIIDSFFNEGLFSMIIKDIGLDPTDFSFPVKPSLQTFLFNIDKSFYNNYALYYGITEIKTDIGFFIEKIKTEKYIKFKKSIQSFYSKDDFDIYKRNTFSVDLKIDDKIKTIKRTYTNIYDIFALIGGYMQILNTIFILLSLLSNRLIPELKILNGIFNFNLKEKKMTMRIRSIKDFNSIVYKKILYFPSDKQLSNLNTKIPNNSIIKNSLIANENCDNKNNNNNNNLSKNCLIGIDNNDNNISSINILNKRKHNSLIVIKESEMEKSNKNSNNNSEKKLSLYNGKKNQYNNYSFNNNNNYNNDNNNNDKDNNINNDNNNNDNNNKSKNYIYRVGSFYPKFQSAQKKQKNEDINNNLKEYTDQIYFNIFNYYCFPKCFKKKKDIELFKLGLSLYRKRMDIINVFTLLLFTEKNCLKSEEFYC